MKKLYHTIWHYFDNFLISLWQNRKTVLIYLLSFIPATVYLGMICFIGKNSGADFFLKSLQAFAFFSAGAFHLYLLEKKAAFQQLRSFEDGFIFTLLVGVSICLTLLSFYLFTDNSMAAMGMISSLAFVFPHTCFHAWLFYKNIPPKQYPLWTSPLNTKDVNEVLMPEVITCRFLISLEKGDMNAKSYNKTIPGDWKLGRAFFSVLKDEQKSTQLKNEFTDVPGELFGWEFHNFLFKGLIKRRLDPEESVTDNRVTENSVVYVTRVSVKAEETQVIHRIQYKTILGSEKSIHTTAKQPEIKLFEKHS